MGTVLLVQRRDVLGGDMEDASQDERGETPNKARAASIRSMLILLLVVVVLVVLAGLEWL